MQVYLVGFMGVGKTTFGRKLSARLQIPCIDLDHFIIEKTGKSVETIFRMYGEKAFRELESDALREASSGSNFLISTGGGAPMHYRNMDFMLQSGLVVWLKMDAAMLFTRLESKKSERPLIKDLNDHELMAFIDSALLMREPVYKQAQIHHLASAKSAQILDQLARTISRYSK